MVNEFINNLCMCIYAAGYCLVEVSLIVGPLYLLLFLIFKLFRD